MAPELGLAEHIQAALSKEANATGSTSSGVPQAERVPQRSPTADSALLSPHSPIDGSPSLSRASSHRPPSASVEHVPSSPRRPKHRTQASFDWFGDEGRFRSDSPKPAADVPWQSVANGRSRTQSNGGSGHKRSQSGQTTAVFTTGSLVADPDDAVPSKIGHDADDAPRGHPLRGAFTIADKERGSQTLKKLSVDLSRARTTQTSSGTSPVTPTFRPVRSTGATGLLDPASPTPTTSALQPSPRTSFSLPRQARKRAQSLDEEVLSPTAEGEWEDEARDQFAEGFAPPKPAFTRKGSMWGGAAGFLATRTTPQQSGTSTPDEGHSSSAEGSEPVGRKKVGARRGSGWGAIKSKLKESKASKTGKKPGQSLSGHELVAELTTGVLPMVLVKMAVMDRDEKGDHRIPILMNYLRLRITDSVYPFHDRHAVFRIELSYGDDAVKWVIYRELKDFLNLHGHYRVANVRQGINKFPTFPKTSIPYLNWLKGDSKKGNVGRADFARAQRESLENYLLKLIRATMFGPGANRLCKFLEISAMSLALAKRGGEQGKQGYLRIMSSGASRRKPSGFHPLSWKNRHDPKWFIVRDSYLVAVNDPASTEIYDVVLVDEDFEIERPHRVYRKGAALFHHSNQQDKSDTEDEGANANANDPERHTSDPAVLNEKTPQGKHGAGDPLDPSATDLAKDDPDALRDASTHAFFLDSSERRLKLLAKTDRQQDQFIASIEKMVAKTLWAGKNRFDSFAPIRLNVAAQWLIDGRDYFWSLSRAIMLAKEKIYIHDWWLSPELYLRRPPAQNEKWRLDRLLQRKAREGVQIFVIVYKEVSDNFTPVDSTYTKTRLRALHPNIHVQRSPSHTSAGTLLWSHHEKMCVIDETIGFMGGLDLCFGRWDSPGHTLVDEGPYHMSPEQASDPNGTGPQIWPGKDYANPRVLDFHTLNKPDEDLYERNKVPRQPWHDIGLQIIGQPARDLCRHFIQRWNYLLRTKNHTVRMPFLLPAPDFTARQLQEQRITGTCEVQICRSVGPWSMGINKVEHSIQNAYIKAIQLSDHFVYIENQFFISSTEVEGTVIENKIGDALVSRILRAHSEGTKWRAVIVIPLVPGYPYPIDHSDAGSVRNIMQCQMRTISHGPHSIFGRLKAEGVDPADYIHFFSLRGWGKLSTGALTTEAVYIHAKAMIVDDRIVIVGSANINERSQRGDRDSELACVIRDTDMMESTMGGEPYAVGRFAHTMRIRLMREHLGVDVDELYAEQEQEAAAERAEATPAEHDQNAEVEAEAGAAPTEFNFEDIVNRAREVHKKSPDEPLGDEGKDQPEERHELKLGGASAGQADARRHEAAETSKAEVGADAQGQKRGQVNEVKTVEEEVMNRQGVDTQDAKAAPHSIEATTSVPGADADEAQVESPQLKAAKSRTFSASSSTRPLPPINERSFDSARPPFAHRDSDKSISEEDGQAKQGGSLRARRGSAAASALLSESGSSLRRGKGSLHGKDKERHNGYAIPVPPVNVDPHGFADPLSDSFFKDVWMQVAVRNTQAFRKVFRCVPDDGVRTWEQLRKFHAWAERHNKPPKDVVPTGDDAPYTDANQPGQGQHGGAGGGGSGGGMMGQGLASGSTETAHNTQHGAGQTQSIPKLGRNRAASTASRFGVSWGADRSTSQLDSTTGETQGGPSVAGQGVADHEEGFPAWEREQMLALLEDVKGTLVVYPTQFLDFESENGNFLFSKDRLPPLAIYD